MYEYASNIQMYVHTYVHIYIASVSPYLAVVNASLFIYICMYYKLMNFQSC